MNNLTIIVPFAGAEKETAVWAREEARIDFRRDPERAARCTTAFAAIELKRCLEHSVSGAKVSFASGRPNDGFCIELTIRDFASKADSFEMDAGENDVKILGHGRTGLLYGAYELLRMQGWRWYSPGQFGEIVPQQRKVMALTQGRTIHTPSMSQGRGFYFEGFSKESTDLLLWMARNGMNMCGCGSATGPFAQKLGMRQQVGGHPFEAILDPDRALLSGMTLWEAHPDWYGLPPDGVRTKARALQTQFCASQPDLLDFISSELLNLAMGDWKFADQFYLVGFDTWGSICQCEGCRKLGGGTEQALHVLSALRQCFDTARSDGRLDHDVTLISCAYEGTTTLDGPVGSFPLNLVEAGDFMGFAPIKRCYAHDFSDATCPDNVFYRKALETWFAPSPRLPMMIDEYYNVTKYEDLPLLFTTRIARDLPAYHALGVRGMTYLHVPPVNWGLRSLTQVLYARLCWDIGTDADALQAEYFRNWYGPHAKIMWRTYEMIEKAWLQIAAWRNWGPKSILTQLMSWDGTRPVEALPGNEHFPTPQAIVVSGRQSCYLLEKALALVTSRRRANARLMAKQQISEQIALAVNPVEAQRAKEQDAYDFRLGEDRRLLIYGLDTMALTTALTAYHDALYRGEQREADAEWKIVDKTADRLDAYYMPIGFSSVSEPGLISKDALTRTQLRETIRRCRQYRKRACLA